MAEKEKQKPPKGGRKGGSLFPKLDLKKAVEYNKKLVSKTHTSPQAEAVILPGVFNSNGPDGKVRASALRQFGLLNEDKAKMEALELGKNIASSPTEELQPILQEACLKPKIFKQLFETFKGDSVSSAKLKQQAVKLNVHPDSADDCVTIFLNSLQYCGLAQVDGDNFLLSNSPNVKPKADEEVIQDTSSADEERNDEQGPEFEEEGANSNNNGGKVKTIKKGSSPIQVHLNLDSTMDSDKLEKFLKLLKNYGAI